MRTLYWETFQSQVMWLALVLLAWPAQAGADGFNDWTGGVVKPGEFLTVPALSFRSAKLDDGTRSFESFPQAQFQVGLFDRVDLILAGATRFNGQGATNDWIYIQPRVELSQGLSFSPGLNLQADKDGDPFAFAPGIFHTFEPDNWQITWNLLAYLTPSDWSASSFFFVSVFERKLNKKWSLYAELDVFHYFDKSIGQMNLTLFVGAMWSFDENDSFNVCLYTPLRPEFEAASTAIGLWWSHGFDIQPVRHL